MLEAEATGARKSSGAAFARCVRADPRADRVARLIGVAAVGVLVAGDDGELSAVAASSPAAAGLDRLQASTCCGPAVDSARAANPVVNTDRADARQRWPILMREARISLINSVHAVPAIRDERVIGVMTLYQRNAIALSPAQIELAGRFAGVLVASAIREAAMSKLRTTIDALAILLGQISEPTAATALVRRGDQCYEAPNQPIRPGA